MPTLREDSPCTRVLEPNLAALCITEMYNSRYLWRASDWRERYCEDSPTQSVLRDARSKMDLFPKSLTELPLGGLPSHLHVNLISATASLAEPPERTPPEMVWTQSISMASLDGSSPPVHLPTTANTGSDISLIDMPKCQPVTSEPSLTFCDRDTASVTAVPPSAKPSICPREILHNPHLNHSRPSPQISQPDDHQKTPPSSRRDIANYRCRTCNIRGSSERWSKCPGKLAAAAISTEPRGPALSSRQKLLSQITPGTLRALASPGSPSTLSDINSLPVPLASTRQCQAPPILAGSSMSTLLSVPGPELVPVPDPKPDLDPPTRDPPNFTTMITTQCEPLTSVISSSHTLLPTKDDPLAGLDTTSFLVDQELSGQDADAGSIPTTIVAAAKVGDQPIATEAALDPAPDGTPGLSSESAPSPPPRNGLVRPWRPLKKKKKGRKKAT
ncbi:mucin-16-like [Macrobrachium rosenbergii]|uniref:mucin-16-like n=1 Tax=Macrobrachium rosenbergii TaxID=79674 RepID=UPI0034D5B056